jgi:hypothetical protein
MFTPDERRQSRRERNLEFLRNQIRQDLEREAALRGESTSSMDSQLIQVRNVSALMMMFRKSVALAQ